MRENLTGKIITNLSTMLYAILVNHEPEKKKQQICRSTTSCGVAANPEAGHKGNLAT